MAWILGLDLGRTGEGAIAFARWFTEAGTPPGAGPLIGVHVLEEEHLRYVLRDHHLDVVVNAATEEVRKRIAAAGAGKSLGDVRVVQGLQADVSLEEVRAAAGADGVIAGRAAPTGGARIVRLGGVVRRLLRTLASPVVVVPPELGAAAIGDGPVVALTNLHEDSASGCRFAAATAQRLGRKWVALHVARGIEAEYLPFDSRERARAAHRAAMRGALEAWLSAHSLKPVVAETVEGSPVEAACEYALRVGSPLLVTGSRRLSTAERAIQSSFGAALAAASPVAVAVVPPPH